MATLNSVTIGNVVLTPWLGGYSTFWEGDEVEFTGSSAVQALFKPRRWGFEITVNDGRQTLYQQLKSMALSQGTNGVLVVDNISPDSGTSTQRQMYILDVKQVSGSISKNGTILTKGTSAKLIEIEPSIW